MMPSRESVKKKGMQNVNEGMQHRIQMSVEIRKAKKSQLLSLKRKCGVLNGNNVANSAIIAELANAFIVSASENDLHALQIALSGSANAAEQLFQFFSTTKKDEKTALVLINMLSSVLLDSIRYEQSGRVDAAKILTNLAASDNPSRKEDQQDPDDLIYGGTATMKDWCCLLLKSNALSALVKVLSTSTIIDIILCEQCCWALANIAGDSYRCRMALLELPENVMSILVNVLQMGISHQIAGLCRNAT